MCGMPLKNFYTVCAEIRGTCHVGEKQKKLIAFAEAIKKRQTTATPAMAPDAPVAAGLTPHLRCAGAILTLRARGERFHYESDAYMSTRQNPARCLDHWALGTRTWGQLFHI